MYFQDLITKLEKFWANHGCVVIQGYDLEVGAGTFNPATFLRVLGPEPWNRIFCYAYFPFLGRYDQRTSHPQGSLGQG